MRATWVVFAKEFLENLRDRRTVLAALVLGPVFGPLLFSVFLQFTIERNDRDESQPVKLAVVGRAAAPNLVAFLASRGIEARDFAGGEDAAPAALRDRRETLVLAVPSDHGRRLAEVQPAPLRLYWDDSDSRARAAASRVRRLVAEYGQGIAAQRLVVRGVDPAVLAPLVVDSVDVSTPETRSVLVLGMLSFFLILSMMTGGLYLAIDTTAGERERGTLEALLATPVPRTKLLYGKLLATASYMSLSLLLTTVSFFYALGRVDLDTLGMGANLGPMVALQVAAAVLPLVPAAATLMTVVASFARSAREAQALLSVVQLAPTLPVAFASIANLAPTLPLMAVPSLSQHFLVTRLLRAEAVSPLEFAVSAGGSLLLGFLLLLLARVLYRREGLIG